MAEKTNPWIEVPAATQLSKEQLEVYGASLEANMMINGAAGSGKTILGIMRAKQLASKGKKVLFITFTNVLNQFTQLAANAFGLTNVDIMMLQDLTYKAFKKRIKDPKTLSDKQLALIIRITGNYDHVIVDEGQDFDLIIYNKIFKKLGNVHTVCVDRKQSIYTVNYSSDEVKNIFSPMMEKILDFTYRNPKNILRTSMEYFVNRFQNSPSELKGTKIKLYNETDGEVRLIHTNNEIDTIAKLIENRGENTVGVLLPNNEAVKYFYDCLVDRDVGKIEYKYNSEHNWENSINFFNTDTKVMTYWSSKGIQFDSVVLPLLNNTYSDRIGFSNKVEEARAFYVAMTRTKKSLYFTKPADSVCPYYDIIPTAYFKTDQREEDPIPKIEDIFDFEGDDEDADNEEVFSSEDDGVEEASVDEPKRKVIKKKDRKKVLGLLKKFKATITPEDDDVEEYSVDESEIIEINGVKYAPIISEDDDVEEDSIDESEIIEINGVKYAPIISD